ncbi:hypothetical protein GYMLUDRAFT_230090 [Collybiopsis luxurians FD-317 M1]|uniref:Uncharacterized protein n=1 Tax=Collybiopsis luxurians FD-317 M1 TaxID=944289 RepID=A0A0D0B0U9_9AGAR|nr:hypothetical protein GYMLUDRAFT_230090 [Collybiopsis luxurians FD-317 M1]
MKLSFKQDALAFLTCFFFWQFSLVSAAIPLINEPANGTAIAPGAAFDFSYFSIADYGVSAYNYTVWLLTSLPSSTAPSIHFASGYDLGKYAEPNYPGNPSPSNPPPAQLIMPDFSKPLGGFGSGFSVSDAIFYLAVVEEYGVSNPTGPGRSISVVMNSIIYNSTN